MAESIGSVSTYDKYLLLLLAKNARDPDIACDLIFRLKFIDYFKGCWFLSDNWADYFVVKKEGAHRLSYKAFIDDLKFNHEICHHCDRKGCINPWHLFQGTHSDNIQDAINKGRLHPVNIKGNPKYSKENLIKIEEAKQIIKNIEIKRIKKNINPIDYIRNMEMFGSLEDLEESYQRIRGDKDAI